MLRHIPIHIRVYKPEYYCFVAYQCLVVALGVRDCFLFLTAICQFPEYACRMPVFVFSLFDDFYPVVGYVHRHAVIESVSAVFYLRCQSRHAAYFFCYGNGIRAYFVNQLVCQCKVANGIVVFVTVIVVLIAAKVISQSVRVIKHRGDTIETESVEVVFLEPKLTIGKQEVYDLTFSIVENQRIPSRMLTPAASMKILGIRTIESSQSFFFIFYGMRVYDIHNHGYTHRMRIVYQVL